MTPSEAVQQAVVNHEFRHYAPATWNVYELNPTGRRLLAEVTGQDARKAAKNFAHDYMTQHNVHCCILKGAS